MTEANKNTVKNLFLIFGGMGILVLLIYAIPNGSIGQKILGGFMMVALIGSIIMFSPLGNPFKKLYRKITGKKEGE